MEVRVSRALFALALLILAAPAMALDYYVAGSFQGWNPLDPAYRMDHVGDLNSLTFTVPSPGRYEFKVTDGSWANCWPPANSWLMTGAANQVITITFDPSAHADGWSGSSNRIGLSLNPTTWTAVGDWQGWNNSNPATAMHAIDGGMYYYEQTLAPGSYQYKAVITALWDAIGTDRSIDAGTIPFTVSADNSVIGFWVDPASGTARVGVGPEPASLLALGASALLLLRSRRR